LQQYENMLQNTVAPAAYVWSEVNEVIAKVVSAQQTLEYYKNQSGSIDSYLSKYENVGYYRNSPCFQLGGCSDEEERDLDTRRADTSDAVKRANADVVKTVDQQQQTLKTDAQSLQRLQAQATTATGQMQALQAANQLAAAQGNQLLQIRGMLLAQNQAAATLAQQQADRQAQQDAAATKLRDKSNITQTSSSDWTFD
jgi:P-type conjugative transfer protein TrbJ